MILILTLIFPDQLDSRYGLRSSLVSCPRADYDTHHLQVHCSGSTVNSIQLLALTFFFTPAD